MGLLVGNTTVIEHAGVTVTHSRTASVNYQSKSFGITFTCPKDIKLPDAYFLAKEIVNFAIEDNYEEKVGNENLLKADELCKYIFGYSILEFSPQPVVKKKGVLKNGFRYMREEMNY